MADVGRVARALPEVTEGSDGFRWLVAGKAFAWAWMERVDPKRPRLLNPRVIAISVAGEAEQRERIAEDPAVFFSEPHYDGYPAVLVRLEVISAAGLRASLERAWRCRAPKRLVAAAP
jgi:hypothetical protein